MVLVAWCWWCVLRRRRHVGSVPGNQEQLLRGVDGRASRQAPRRQGGRGANGGQQRVLFAAMHREQDGVLTREGFAEGNLDQPWRSVTGIAVKFDGVFLPICQFLNMRTPSPPKKDSPLVPPTVDALLALAHRMLGEHLAVLLVCGQRCQAWRR